MIYFFTTTPVFFEWKSRICYLWIHCCSYMAHNQMSSSSHGYIQSCLWSSVNPRFSFTWLLHSSMIHLVTLYSIHISSFFNILMNWYLHETFSSLKEASSHYFFFFAFKAKAHLQKWIKFNEYLIFLQNNKQFGYSIFFSFVSE